MCNAILITTGLVLMLRLVKKQHCMLYSSCDIYSHYIFQSLSQVCAVVLSSPPVCSYHAYLMIKHIYLVTCFVNA